MSEYRKHPAINYSLLKSVAKNPYEIKHKQDISEYPSVKRGDILDMYFEDPTLIVKKYKYYEGDIPSATLLELAEAVIDYCKKEEVEKPYSDLIIEIIDANDYWSNLKDTYKETKKYGKELIKSRNAKLIEKFDQKEFWDYVNFQLDNKRIIVEREIINDVVAAENTIKNHPHTKAIFDTSKREVIYQQEIYEMYEYAEGDKLIKKEIKVLLDLLSIDHEKKIIYPYDFKFLTGYSVFKFSQRFLEMYYYIQSGLYTYAINKWVKKNYPDYRVVNYNFIVISNKNLKLPLIFDSFDYIKPALYGFEKNGRHYPGINQLMSDLEWHKENDLWEHRREIYENNGVVKLKL